MMLWRQLTVVAVRMALKIARNRTHQRLNKYGCGYYYLKAPIIISPAVFLSSNNHALDEADKFN